MEKEKLPEAPGLGVPVVQVVDKVQGAGASCSATSVGVLGTNRAQPLLRLTTAGR